ncbi:hypothetical protein [Rhodococcus qingshengii]
MAIHPFQGSLDNLVSYLSDAQNILESIHLKNTDLVTQRVNQGSKTGAGAPPAHQRSLNRAVVVAAVGATEAFFEDLALSAHRAEPTLMPPSRDWYKIDGPGGMVQTPSPHNLAKMLWTLYRYDPRPDWDVVVTTSPKESNTGTSNWRIERTHYRRTNAAGFFAAMVKVRHGFAHQDAAQVPPHMAGIVNRTNGKMVINSHHAENSISSVLQMAIQSTIGLGKTLEMTGNLRWKRSMTNAGWGEILAGTPVAATISASSNWTHHPWLAP